MAGDMTCAEKIWNPSGDLSPRIKKLRDEFFSFYTRDYFRNQVMPFTTGEPWDAVWSAHNWGVVPELFPFFDAVQDSLLACATKAAMPDSFWKESINIRRAAFFSTVMTEKIPVQILDGELIVGGQFNTALSKNLTKAEAKKHAARLTAWKKEIRLLNEAGIGNCGAIPGHLIPNYKKVLEVGFKGIAAEIRDALVSAVKRETKDRLNSMLICCEAAQKFAARYSEEARRLADAETDPARKSELLEISEVCARVPWSPAKTFHEALQSLWFTHMMVMAAESYPGAGLSYGRIDQYLNPYYKSGIEDGSLTPEHAKELLMCFWIKHNYAYDYQGFIGTNQGINSGFGQLVTLSGLGPNGEDMTNETTWLMLDIIDEINLLEPKPNVRLHRNSPPELMRRLCEMLSRAQGAPFLLNFDENSIRGLKWQGLPEEDLWDYAPVGCLENTLQGNDRSGTVDVNLNIAKAVELAMNRGRDSSTGKKLGPDTGDPAAFKDFEELYTAFTAQLAAIGGRLVKCNDEADAIRAEFEPTPYLSCLVDGCIKNGKDITEGGAEHNYITVEGIAFATAVDSLSAVKKLVFDEKRITMPELLKALDDNFKGHERVQTMLKNRAPKYGNDDDEADAMAERLNRHWSEGVFDHVSPATNRRYRTGYLSWNYWIAYAPGTGPTPDGRARGSFLSNGIGPVNGMDKGGPTAAIRSVGKVGLECAPNGASHTMSVSPSLIRDIEHLDKMASMLRAYAVFGGTALQVNMLDPKTLSLAQQNPEEYGNLLVRITGYNAYFVNLGREIQNEIIARESGSI